GLKGLKSHQSNFGAAAGEQRFDESFSEAWDRFNELLRACPHHGFFELHQLDTFYNTLNVNDQDSLNSAAGGNFLDKIPADCLKIIESKSKVRQTRAKVVVAKVNFNSSTPAVSSDVAELKDMVRALLLDKKNQYSAQTSSPTPAPIKAVEPNCVTCGGSGTLTGNTVTNPKEDLKEHPSDTKVLTMKMEILLEPTSNKFLVVDFNSLVHSYRALSTLRRFSLRIASAAVKPCQGDSLKFYLITAEPVTEGDGLILESVTQAEEDTDQPLDNVEDTTEVNSPLSEHSLCFQHSNPSDEDMHNVRSEPAHTHDFGSIGQRVMSSSGGSHRRAFPGCNPCGDGIGTRPTLNGNAADAANAADAR
nr:reverse transcriptase domain-containing protein [Tanacetum cinerariifolium]